MMTAAKIVETVPWIDAKYYAATQTMDEARHTEVFAKYLHTKLGEAYPMSPFLEEQITALLEDSRWDIAYLGMQIVIESLALAAFGTMLRNTEEPLLKKLLRYVMSDEARHVAFGVLSLAEYYQGLTEAELKDRQEFLIENTLRNRLRSTTPEIWERMGVSAEAVSRHPRGRRQAQGQPVRRVPAGLLRQARAQRPQARPARRQRRLPAQGVGRGRAAGVRVRRRHRAPTTRPTTPSRRTGRPRPLGRRRRLVTTRTLRGAAALVGVADAASPTGELDRHGRALEAAMIHEALADAGLTLDDVDGVATPARPAGFAEYLGIRPRYLDGTMVGGSSFELHVEHAAAAIAAGLCDVVVGVYASTPRSDRKRPGAGLPGMPPGPNPAFEWELPYGLRMPMGALRAGRQPPHGPVRHHARAARADRGRHPALGGAEPPGPLPRPDHRRRRAGVARWWSRRCTCSTAAWSPTAPAPSC